MRDPYEVLGVAKNASAKDIKSAYRKLAKKHHPDQNPNDPKAKDRFAAVNQAYEVVGDEKARGAYDRGEIDAEGKPKFQGFEGAAGGDPFAGFRRQQGPGGAHFEFRSGRPGGDPFDGNSDIFSQIFGDAFSGARGAGRGDRRQPVQAADLNVTMDISIEEAASADKVTAMFPDGRKVAVKLPAYVEDGQTIRLKGQGEQGPGQPGDALVKIHIRRHTRYRIEGRDLHVDLPVDLADAVLGAKVAVETPTGKLAVNVPAWSSSDKVLRLKGRGLPEKAGGHGDLYAHVRLMLPEGGDAELEALMRRQKG
ncbi:J domain-containing protein [Mesorhizobium sp. B2-8-3]|uniref:DnaJ C-terminal domain-containing protein n=1 Tax=Mesorhizobium sp. B2-8-3 TaxID=2589905 RepID=UPI00112D583C|nr:J domain-containing protein [Mesorhizobium sp. B2-8-3]TPJ29912.1 J domain-containing protein [Mesorhizobium sp. B2-8-3]